MNMRKQEASSMGQIERRIQSFRRGIHRRLAWHLVAFPPLLPPPFLWLTRSPHCQLSVPCPLPSQSDVVWPSRRKTPSATRAPYPPPRDGAALLIVSSTTRLHMLAAESTGKRTVTLSSHRSIPSPAPHKLDARPMHTTRPASSRTAFVTGERQFWLSPSSQPSMHIQRPGPSMGTTSIGENHDSRGIAECRVPGAFRAAFDVGQAAGVLLITASGTQTCLPSTVPVPSRPLSNATQPLFCGGHREACARNCGSVHLHTAALVAAMSRR